MPRTTAMLSQDCQVNCLLSFHFAREVCPLYGEGYSFWIFFCVSSFCFIATFCGSVMIACVISLSKAFVFHDTVALLSVSETLSRFGEEYFYKGSLSFALLVVNQF